MNKIFKLLWNIIKHVFLLPMYCSSPDKYSGKTYDEWLEETEQK